MSGERKTTRRNILRGIGTAATTAAFAGCNNIIEGNNQQDGQGYETGSPTTSPTTSPPSADPELFLKVVKNPEVNLKPNMGHINQIGEVATVLQGNANTGTQDDFDQINILLNGNTENPVTVDPQSLEKGIVLPPSILQNGENSIQLNAEYNGQTYTSDSIKQKTSFPTGHRLDIQVPEDVEISKGLENVTQYSTPFKYDNYTWTEPPVHEKSLKPEALFRQTRAPRDYVKGDIDPDVKKQVEQSQTLEEMLEIVLDPFQDYMADKTNEGQKNGISGSAIEMALTLEYMAEEFAGIESHFWGYHTDPINEQGNAHGLISSYDIKNGERWEVETTWKKFTKPSNWTTDDNWDNMMRDHNKPRDQKAIMEQDETRQDAYKGGKIMNTDALINVGAHISGNPDALYLPDDFLIPRRDTMQQDQIRPWKFKQIHNQLRLVADIHNTTSNARDEEGAYQGAEEVTGVTPTDDLAIYVASPEHEKAFHEIMMDTVYDRGTQVTADNIGKLLS